MAIEKNTYEDKTFTSHIYITKTLHRYFSLPV